MSLNPGSWCFVPTVGSPGSSISMCLLPWAWSIHVHFSLHFRSLFLRILFPLSVFPYVSFLWVYSMWHSTSGHSSMLPDLVVKNFWKKKIFYLIFICTLLKNLEAKNYVLLEEIITISIILILYFIILFLCAYVYMYMCRYVNTNIIIVKLKRNYPHCTI